MLNSNKEAAKQNKGAFSVHYNIKADPETINN
jgi:hypothetical protein